MVQYHLSSMIIGLQVSVSQVTETNFKPRDRRRVAEEVNCWTSRIKVDEHRVVIRAGKGPRPGGAREMIITIATLSVVTGTRAEIETATVKGILVVSGEVKVVIDIESLPREGMNTLLRRREGVEEDEIVAPMWRQLHHIHLCMGRRNGGGRYRHLHLAQDPVLAHAAVETAGPTMKEARQAESMGEAKTGLRMAMVAEAEEGCAWAVKARGREEDLEHGRVEMLDGRNSQFDLFYYIFVSHRLHILPFGEAFAACKAQDLTARVGGLMIPLEALKTCKN